MRNTSYDALDVARHIINYVNNKGGAISNLKLQKLLYFIQGFFLILKKKPCFKDDIEAWDFGPVVPNVYFEFRKYGSGSIPKIETIYKFSILEDFGDELGISGEKYEDKINLEDAQLIDDVVNALKNHSASALVTMTHKQDPWKNTYEKHNIHNVISIDCISDYFKERYLS